METEEQLDVQLQSFEKALELNKRIRDLFENEIIKVNKILSINKKIQVEQEKIEEEQLQSQSGRRESLKTSKVFAAPYFQDSKEMVPPPNEDSIIKKTNHEVNPFLTHPRKWTPIEQKQLMEGVITYAYLFALKSLTKERDRIRRKMQNKNLTVSEMEDLEDNLYVTEQKIRLINCKPVLEILEKLNGNIDWMIVSAKNMQGMRTPEECEIMWNNWLRFDINKNPFSEHEDTKLADLAKDYSEKNWDKIAAELKAFEKINLCIEFFLRLCF